MKQRTIRTGMIAVCFLGITACVSDEVSTVDSHTVQTSEIAAYFWATADADGNVTATARVRVTWRPVTGVQSTPFLTMTGGDRLLVAVGDIVRELEPVVVDGPQLHYIADLGPDLAQPGDEIKFIFERNEGVYDSTVLPPEPFEIVSPAPGDSFSTDTTITVECTIPGTWISLDGPCIASGSGYFILQNGETVGIISASTRTGHVGETCSAELGVSRENVGTVAPDFDPEHSRIKANQRRTVDITISAQ